MIPLSPRKKGLLTRKNFVSYFFRKWRFEPEVECLHLHTVSMTCYSISVDTVLSSSANRIEVWNGTSFTIGYKVVEGEEGQGVKEKVRVSIQHKVNFHESLISLYVIYLLSTLRYLTFIRTWGLKPNVGFCLSKSVRLWQRNCLNKRRGERNFDSKVNE